MAIIVGTSRETVPSKSVTACRNAFGSNPGMKPWLPPNKVVENSMALPAIWNSGGA